MAEEGQDAECKVVVSRRARTFGNAPQTHLARVGEFPAFLIEGMYSQPSLKVPFSEFPTPPSHAPPAAPASAQGADSCKDNSLSMSILTKILDHLCQKEDEPNESGANVAEQ